MVTPTIRLVELLGEGGMGSVWRADHLEREGEVAVKFIFTELAKQAPQLVARFKEEAETTARIDDAHAVQVFDHGLTGDGTPYLVLELLRGSNLADWLALAGKLGGHETRLLVSQVGGVLGRAHALGIVHRDIKPANLFLVDADDELLVKVLDFGVAKRLEKHAGDSITATGVMVGTVEYMSPEQIRAAKHVDGRADLWSLAVVAYQCLTGSVPFTGESVYKVCSAVMAGNARPPSQFNPRLPKAVDRWFTRALAAKLDGRFATAEELITSFAEAIGDSPKRSWLRESSRAVLNATERAAVLAGETAITERPADSDPPPESLQSIFGPSSSDAPLSSSRVDGAWRPPRVIPTDSLARESDAAEAQAPGDAATLPFVALPEQQPAPRAAGDEPRPPARARFVALVALVLAVIVAALIAARGTR